MSDPRATELTAAMTRCGLSTGQDSSFEALLYTMERQVQCLQERVKLQADMIEQRGTPSPDLKASQRPTVSSEATFLTKGTEPGAVTDGREWFPVALYPDDNSVVLAANPDEGRLPVIAWKVEDTWYPYDLRETKALDPQPTLWTQWPRLPKGNSTDE